MSKALKPRFSKGQLNEDIPNHIYFKFKSDDYNIPILNYDAVGDTIREYYKTLYGKNISENYLDEIQPNIYYATRHLLRNHNNKVREKIYNDIIKKVKSKVLSKAKRNKHYYSKDELTKYINDVVEKINERVELDISDIDDIYTMYDENYRVVNAKRDETKQTKQTIQSKPIELPQPRKSTPKVKQPKSKILTINIQNTIPKNVIENINGTGFKSPNKVLKIINNKFPDNRINISDVKQHLKLPIDSFPLKDNKKKYSLHVVAPIGTYIMDLMFVSGFVYLIAINVNTRKAYAVSTTNYSNDDEANRIIIDKTGEKSVKNILDALIHLISYTDFKPRIIRGDGEKSFNSKYLQQWFKNEHITFIPVRRLSLNNTSYFDVDSNDGKRNDPQHGSLSIIDRFIRTIRDMAYNMKIKYITPEIMEILVDNYNMAPHKHLSKYLGEPTSPNDMDEDREKYIIRKICQENYNIRDQAWYHLPSGMSVDVYNEKDSMFKRRSKKRYGNYHIVDYKGGLYNVRDGDNDIWVPRYMIAPCIR